MTFNVFHSVGSVHWSRDVWNRAVYIGYVFNAVSFRRGVVYRQDLLLYGHLVSVLAFLDRFQLLIVPPFPDELMCLCLKCLLYPRLYYNNRRCKK